MLAARRRAPRAHSLPLVTILVAFVTATACGRLRYEPVGVDAATDAGIDATVLADASADAPALDAGADARVTPLDAPSDVGVDVLMNAAMDADLDAPELDGSGIDAFELDAPEPPDTPDPDAFDPPDAFDLPDAFDPLDAFEPPDGGRDAGPPVAARPIWPPSTSTVSSLSPSFEFEIGPAGDEGLVEICRDRSCAIVLMSFAGPRTARPPGPLPSAVGTPATLFWRVTARRGGVLAGPPSAVWSFVARAVATPMVDTAFGTQIDLERDGLTELVVSADARVLAHTGGPGGPAPIPIVLDTVAAGTTTSLAAAGDLDGDGLGEILVGAPSASRIRILSRLADGSIAVDGRVGAAGSGFGQAVAGIGDVNRDGYGDFAVSHPAEQAVSIYVGGAPPPMAPALILTPALSTPGFGSAISAGDFDGDGFSDVAVGAPGGNRVFIYRGSATGLGPTAARVLGSTGFEFGAALAGDGDLSGDGYADLVVGAPASGLIFIYRGGSGFIASAADDTRAHVLYTRLGASVAMVRDLDRDGRDDVLAGDGAEGVLLFPGRPLAFDVVYDLSMAGVDAGTVVAGIGDADGDGRCDAALGAPGSNLVVYIRDGAPLPARRTISGVLGMRHGAAIAH